MVASASVDASAVVQSKPLTATEEYFCRLIAFDGRSQTTAYRIAWKSSRSTAKVCAGRVMARPHVQARLAQMRQEAYEAAKLSMAERLALLAETARTKPRERPTHSDRISAVREYSVLTGERRTDGTQVNIAGDVSFTQVLGALRAPGSSAQAQPVIDVPAERQPEMPALAAPVDSGEVSGPGRAPQPPSSSGGPVCGPLGVVQALSNPDPTETRSPEAIAFED